ncbi:MAG TPA: hypothetical protein VM186_02210 [Planctomycetota bacterium]|nr:hypothetical protein [Planctomycetota bacterium]
MIFQHSAVTSVAPWQAEETAARMPADIHPAFLGSGNVAFGLDATGMQGLDARVMEQPEVVSMWHMTTHLSDDLMIRHAATLSKHYRIEHDTFARDVRVPWGSGWGLLPAGFFDYALTIDRERYEPADLLRAAANWRRTFNPLTGTCTTAFDVAGTRITWEAAIAPGSELACFPLTVASLDGKTHDVDVEVRVHCRTRRGEAIATGALVHTEAEGNTCVQWAATDSSSAAPLKAPYWLSWGIGMDQPTRHTWDGTTLSSRARATVDADASAHIAVALFFGCSQAGAGTHQDAELALHDYRHDPRAALNRAQEGWRQYFADAATFSAGHPQMEFVYHTNQYLMAAGADWAHGIPCNYLWNQNFQGSTFWDSYFMVEGMLRAGHVDRVRPFIRWLAETAMQEGRPFYWIHYYDGEPWADDVAYQVMAAHAGSAILYYEYTRDQEALRKWVYPIAKRVALYTRERLIGQFDGLWRFKVIMSGDVTGDDKPGTRETGVLAWLVVAMAKAVEYGRRLGEDAAVLAPLAEVVESTRQHPYDWSTPVMWWSWLPYITNADPFYDREAWKRGIADALLGAGVRHMRYNDIGQPWGAFSAATSCLINGLPNAALSYLENGLHKVYGLGAFCEFRYDKNENAGIAPLPTASGAYLSAIGAIFAHGTIWDDGIRVLDSLPSTWMSRPVRFANIRTPNGATISGESAPDRVCVTVQTDRTRTVTLGVPVRLWGVPLTLTVNGASVSPAISPDGRSVEFRVNAGRHEIQLVEDAQTAYAAVLFEPKYRANYFQEILAGAGVHARLVRDPRLLPAHLAAARMLLLPSSMIQHPSYLAEAVERFVHAGGCVVGLHHAGCSEVNPRLAELFGVRAATEDRFKKTFTPCTVRVGAAHHLTAGLPAAFELLMADRLTTPQLADDMTVLCTRADTGDAVATLRPVGQRGGLAIWLAPGQEAAGAPKTPYSRYDAIDILGRRADEMFSYPYLEEPAFRELLVRAVRMGLQPGNTDRRS